MFVGLALFSATALAARPPEPERAQERVAELSALVAKGELSESDLYPMFLRPRGPAESLRFLYQQDQERLLAALAPDGPLGRVLVTQPGTEAVVVGPDYTRVVLDTEPHLSFIVVRQGGDISIERWEVTRCGDCREPVRFVTDMLAEVGEDEENRLVPGLDLWLGVESLETFVEPEELFTENRQVRENSVDWRLAFQNRNMTAGYLRFVLDGAEVLGMDVDGVEVGLRDSVESWKVSYRDQAWRLDYQALPVNSLLRLDPSDANDWRSESYVQAQALLYWTALAGAGQSSGATWARRVTAIGYDPVADRWLLVLQRPDRKVCQLVGLDPDGTVSLKLPLPSWPTRLPPPVPDWQASWQANFGPAGDRLLLSAGGATTIISLPGGQEVTGSRGLLGNITASAWSPDGQRVVLGDERGGVGVFSVDSLQPVQIRYPGGDDGWEGDPYAPVTGLAYSLAGDGLLVARRDGRVEELALPGLASVVNHGGLCCGELQGMSNLALRGEALLSCGQSCLPLVITRMFMVGQDPPHLYSDAALMGPARLTVSHEGRWLVMTHLGAGGSMALCRADDLVAQATFGDLPPLDVVWNADETSFMVLQVDGSVTHWTLDEVLR